MRIHRATIRDHKGAGTHGFTMVEIAIALAVIAFALVAIIGVLPSGLQVQKESREKTLINEDARYFLDAIRTGARDLQDLTNFVREVSVGSNTIYNLTSGAEIIGLLSTPTTNQPNQAVVRAVTSSATDRGSSPEAMDFAFQYLMTVNVDSALPTINPDHPHWGAFLTNRGNVYLWDIRLEFRWPWLPSGQVGDQRAVYRTLISGRLVRDSINPDLYFFRP